MSRKTQTHLKRREFLNSAAGTVAWGVFLGTVLPASKAAETAAKGTPSSSALDDLLAEMEAQGNRFMSVPRPGCQLLQLLVKLGRCRSVLELGTSQGYSTLWLALALKETKGKITTVDMRMERVEAAQNNLARAGLTESATFLHGDAHALVSTLDGPFDFVFLDADKPGNFDYFEKLYPDKLSPGALLVARKAVTMRDSMVKYLETLESHPAFHSIIVRVPEGDDYSLAYRRRVH